ncbi:adenosine receptor A1-like [Gadus macrocephalus]|uniref:adenosine receptor A1-like n=1 Tax=Gadus macrocephalus TaxID=80720 RepID=UPI0028CB6545|nr:adenosine receptor A1-like [Gadus macrocephalus]
MSFSLGVRPREQVDLLYISMETAIALASVLGNVLVVAAVVVNRSLRDTTFCFIASLAVADIAVGALVIPLAVVISLGLETQFYTCLLLSCLLLVITQGSILSLLAIAVDRFLRVKIPTRYCVVVTPGRARVAVGLCWLLSFISGLVPMLGWHVRPDPRLHGNASGDAPIACRFTSVVSMHFMVYFNFLGCVVVPLVVMTALYGEIFRVICVRLGRRAEATCDGDDGRRYYQKELRLAKSLALVVALFALCWLPLHILNCVALFCPSCPLPKAAVYTGIFLSHVNSALNPLVYAFRIKRFRVTLIRISRRCGLCRPAEPSLFPEGKTVLTG